MNATKQKYWNSYFKWPIYVFLAIGIYVVWTGHLVRGIEYLPLVLLVPCVVMHFFMHGSHGGAKDHDAGSHTQTNDLAANSEFDADDSGAKS